MYTGERGHRSLRVHRFRGVGRAYGPGGSLPGGLSVAQLEFLSCLAKAGLVVRSGGTTNRRTALLDLTAALPKATRRSLGSSLPALRELTGAVDALADDVLQDARQIADEATA